MQLREKLAPVFSTATPEPVFIEPPSYARIKYRTDFSRYWNDFRSITEIKPFFSKAKELLAKAIAERTDARDYSEDALLAELKEKTSDNELYKRTASMFETCNVHLYAPFESQTDLQLYFNEVKDLIEKLQAES